MSDCVAGLSLQRRRWLRLASAGALGTLGLVGLGGCAGTRF